MVKQDACSVGFVSHLGSDEAARKFNGVGYQLHDEGQGRRPLFRSTEQHDATVVKVDELEGQKTIHMSCACGAAWSFVHIKDEKIEKETKRDVNEKAWGNNWLIK